MTSCVSALPQWPCSLSAFFLMSGRSIKTSHELFFFASWARMTDVAKAESVIARTQTDFICTILLDLPQRHPRFCRKVHCSKIFGQEFWIRRGCDHRGIV